MPSGASTGIYEALELRDGDKQRYLGKGEASLLPQPSHPSALYSDLTAVPKSFLASLSSLLAPPSLTQPGLFASPQVS